MYLSIFDLERGLESGRVVLNHTTPLAARIAITGMMSLWVSWMVFGVGGAHAIGWFGFWIATLVLPFAFLVYALWAGVNRLTLDLDNRIYLLEKGIYPIIRRRQGDIDAFQRLECVQQRYNNQSGTFLYWSLTFRWKEGRHGSPSYAIQHSYAVEDVVQKLARKLNLPLSMTPLDEANQESGKWVVYVVLGMFAAVFLFIAVSILYGIYEGRGPRFPKHTGERQIINLKMGDFVARTLLVKLTHSQMETATGEHGGVYLLQDYEVTVDIENTGPYTKDLDFVIGFSGHTREHKNTGRMRPGEHRMMTAYFHTSEQPNSVFLRPSP